MGLICQFSCPACGYTAEVAGGPDHGMVASRKTFTCMDCRELGDVTVSLRGPEPHRIVQPVAARCPSCRSGRLAPWTHPGPCPRCGTVMRNGEVVEFWD
jgi:hypothetical protein